MKTLAQDEAKCEFEFLDLVSSILLLKKTLF